MESRQHKLAEFLQALRQRSAPEAFGFPVIGRRRTKGLRREEVAQLANISPTWYTWIEQGRNVNVSAETLDRLAQALKLSRSERNYLFEVAARRDPQSANREEDLAPEVLVSIIANISTPAYIMGRIWDVLAWNQPAAELFSDWLGSPGVTAGEAPPNLLRFVFQNGKARHFVVNWEMRVRRLVAEFRADCRSRLEEPELQQLVAELSQTSPDFDRVWRQHDVLERQGGRREFNHPVRGFISYQQVTLHPVEQEQLKLVLLIPG